MSGKTIREPPGWNPPPWVAVHPTMAYFKAEKLPPEACKAWVLDTMRGCMTGEREEGSDADRLLRDAAERMARRSNAGKAGAAGRWGSATECERNANALRTECERNANALRTECERNAKVCHNRTGDNRTNKRGEERRARGPTDARDARESGFEYEDATTPPPPSTPSLRPPTPDPTTSPGTRRTLEQFSADPYGYRDCLPTELLPNCVVAFCEEADPDRALGTYQRLLQRKGGRQFREEFYRFMDDCLKSDPDVRGAAFVARLQALQDISEISHEPF